MRTTGAPNWPIQWEYFPAVTLLSAQTPTKKYACEHGRHNKYSDSLV